MPDNGDLWTRVYKDIVRWISNHSVWGKVLWGAGMVSITSDLMKGVQKADIFKRFLILLNVTIIIEFTLEKSKYAGMVMALFYISGIGAKLYIEDYAGYNVWENYNENYENYKNYKNYKNYENYENYENYGENRINNLGDNARFNKDKNNKSKPGISAGKIRSLKINLRNGKKFDKNFKIPEGMSAPDEIRLPPGMTMDEARAKGILPDDINIAPSAVSSDDIDLGPDPTKSDNCNACAQCSKCRNMPETHIIDAISRIKHPINRKLYGHNDAEKIYRGICGKPMKDAIDPNELSNSDKIKFDEIDDNEDEAEEVDQETKEEIEKHREKVGKKGIQFRDLTHAHTHKHEDDEDDEDDEGGKDGEDGSKDAEGDNKEKFTDFEDPSPFEFVWKRK